MIGVLEENLPGASVTLIGDEKQGIAWHGVLTERQVEILHLLRRNMSNKEIARSLRLSPFTVRNYLSQLMKIYRVRSRAEILSRLTDVPMAGGTAAEPSNDGAIGDRDRGI